ncbi:hypothetical protein HNQ64_001896 [Prosthecobacter dejongeii]|uniref:Uncharacterized protein n=1 Tax=Prosthecobacter dejongeii TaxID=48465 RepID=A0A7W7YKH0_9BACT|nr:hypothetical protein [Prosthecobacter dejongeii]
MRSHRHRANACVFHGDSYRTRAKTDFQKIVRMKRWMLWDQWQSKNTGCSFEDNCQSKTIAYRPASPPLFGQDFGNDLMLQGGDEPQGLVEEGTRDAAQDGA